MRKSTPEVTCSKYNLQIFVSRSACTSNQYLVKYFFNYCPLVSIFCYQEIMHKMNKIHERSMRLLFKNYKDDFQDLLRSSADISIPQRCINSLLTEVYNDVHGFYQSKYL